MIRTAACSVLLCSVTMLAQKSTILQPPADAPLNFHAARVSLPSNALPQAPVPQNPPAPAGGVGNPQQVPSTPGSASAPRTLSIQDAEQLALKNNPQISVARLNALASEQVTREARSALWPTAVTDLTGVDSRANSRIAAGGLNNPIIFERAAVGASVTQLITDFGHTANLISSANLSAKAQNQNAIATEYQIRLAADQAFYGGLQAHSVTRVAEQTVSARQTVADQIEALFKSKLKSQLDLSFASVNLSQAKLLLLDAQNNENAALAALSAVLGYATVQDFQLVEDTSPLTQPPANIDGLVSEAFAKRPELLALNFESESARKFQTAERDLLFPTVRAAGAVGDTPVRNPALSNWYGAVGVNIDIPIFNGFLYSARAQEARFRAQAAHGRLIDLRNRVSRDVRTSWLNASTAYNRLAVTKQLLEQANLALDLAQTRYKLGLGSIVELSQAQLQQTQAEISNAQAGYDYRLALAVLRFQTGS
jgi:outer membrane protein